MTPLATTESVIEALGGVHAVALMINAKSHSVVHNWRKRGVFPPTSFMALNEALAMRGLNAHPDLWRQIEFKPAEQSDPSEAAS